MTVEQMWLGQCVRKAETALWVGLACAAGLLPLVIPSTRRHASSGWPLKYAGRRYLRSAWAPAAAVTAALGVVAFGLVKLASISLPVAPAIFAMWFSVLGISLVLGVLSSDTRPDKEQST